MPSLIAPFLLTAAGREAILAGTLASWDRSDWGARPVDDDDAPCRLTHQT